jgi:F-type H+-transporting ATPase subunit a
MKRWFVALLPLALAWARTENEEVPTSFILEHVKDSYDWHITDIPWGRNPDGSRHYIAISVPLPRILYHPQRGLSVFFVHGHTEAEIKADLEKHGYTLGADGKIAAIDCQPILDLSLTKTAFQLLLVGMLLLWIGRAAAKAYQKTQNGVPTGAARILEPVILFIRNEVALPNLHHHTDRFMPFLLTVFFFIWLSNLVGLTPLNSNIMGNITLTFLLALIAFLVIHVNASKAYWSHIFWYPGVPVWLKLFMMPIEIIGMFAKPFALMMRLFANILAGHLMTLSIIGLIFILAAVLKSAVVGLGVSVFSVLLGLFVMALETLVAALQAYIFTMLSAVFLGMAMEESH